MNKNTTILGITLTLVAGLAIGYFGAGYQYSAQLDKAKKMFPTQAAMLSVSGTIKSVSGNTITLQTAPSTNPFEDLPTAREVKVISATKIVKSEMKESKIYQQEMADYQKAIQSAQKAASAGGSSTTPAATNLPVPPQTFKETVLKISDLKVGDVIFVDAGKDIKTQTSFEAVKITLSGTGAAAAFTPADVNISGGANKGTAPIVNTPQVRTDGGVPPQ